MIPTCIKRLVFSLVFTIFLLLSSLCVVAQQRLAGDDFQRAILHPPAAAKPWVFWYWMHGAVSKEGITADLEAMKEVGIGGAYLMPIKGDILSFGTLLASEPDLIHLIIHPLRN